GDQHLGSGLGVAPDQFRDQLGVTALVQNVAGDDRVEAAECGQRFVPAHVPVGHRRQVVERGVVGEEHLGQRVRVGGGDVGAAPLQHQAGQADAAAEFEDALAFDVETLHRVREQRAGRPQLPEQAPGGRGDAGALAVPVGVGELLGVAEYAQPERTAGDGVLDFADLVTWHRPSPEDARPQGDGDAWKGRWEARRISILRGWADGWRNGRSGAGGPRAAVGRSPHHSGCHLSRGLPMSSSMRVVLSVLLLAAVAPIALASDGSVESRLEARGIEYQVDADGDYMITLFYTDEGRTQLVFVGGTTETVGGYTVREVFAPAARLSDGIDGDLALKLLTDSRSAKLGAWELGGDILYFVIKLPEEIDAARLEAAINIAASTADDMEIQISGDRDEL